jgi:hypothetical protein
MPRALDLESSQRTLMAMTSIMTTTTTPAMTPAVPQPCSPRATSLTSLILTPPSTGADRGSAWAGRGDG